MNMKKTIAAVAACAVATSAMATTVFADDSVTIHYNLTHNYYSKTEGSVTFTSTLDYLQEGTTDGDYVQIAVMDTSVNGVINMAKGTMTVSGNTVQGGVKDKDFNFVDYAEGQEFWTLKASSWLKYDKDNDAMVMTIPIADKGIKASDGGFTCEISFTAPHLGNDWNGADLGAKFSYVYGTELAAVPVTDVLAGTTAQRAQTAAYVADLAKGDNATGVEPILLGDLVDPGEIVDGTGIEYSWHNNYVTEIYAMPNVTTGAENEVVLHNVLSAWSQAAEAVYKFPMMTSANTVSSVGGSVLGEGDGTYRIENVTDNQTGLCWWEQRDKITGEMVPTTVDGSVSNILEYLGDDSWNLISKGKSYVNVVPVINDIIANYDDVTFTFNTAADGVETVNVESDPTKSDDKNENGFLLDYSAKGDKQYTKFSQHLYNLYGDEGTEYVYAPTTYDWTGYNLWAGALVVNGNLTMSLQDTNVFDYGATTLSFNWNDAIDGAVVNTYATYLTKMQLATSAVWFWDSLDITGAATESEEVKSEAGVEAEEDVIEEDVEEDVVEEDIEEDVVEEDVEEDVVEDVEEPVVEDVPVVENPGTGNAPIALAVIPVALAAAAVVAKKRG